MSSSIFTNGNKPVKHTGRNPFDNTSAHSFAMRPGITRPVVFQSTVPNSSFKINCGDLIRTDALQQAAFVRGRQELDFFFIPYRQLFTNFDHVVFGKGDFLSPLELSSNSTNVPTVPLRHLIEQAAFVYIVPTIWYKYCKAQGINDVTLRSQAWSEMCIAFLSGLEGDGVTLNQAQEDFLFRISIFDSLTLQDLNDQSTLNSPYDYHLIGASCLQILSSLQYGDYQLFLDNAFFAGFGGDEFNFDRLPYLLDGLVACGSCLAELLGGLRIRDKEVNLLALHAYQKVWKDVYRDSLVDDSPLYVYSSNADMGYYDRPFQYLISSISDVSDIDYALQRCLAYTVLRPRLRQYKKDLSTGLWPSTQDGLVANFNTNEDYNIGVNNLNVPLTGTTNPPSVNADNAYAIKFTLALQKYRESLMRAGNRTKDLLMAEFGVQSRYIDDTYVHPIGSFGGSFDINKVACTSESGTYSVGDLAANMVSSLTGDTIEFTCNDYGIIIGVMSFLPQMFLNAYGVSRHHSKVSQFDFYHEEFENLGLVPVGTSEFDVISQYSSAESTLGFGARNYEYKQQLDLAHDSFCTPSDLPLDMFRLVGHREYLYSAGVDSNYINVKPQAQVLSSLKDRNYIFPDSMDAIFKNLDDGTNENAHFKVCLQTEINSVLPMSVTGMM